MKILIWDLETSASSFRANAGFILCATIKELGKPVEVFRRDNMRPDPLNDRKLVKQIAKRLSEADMWVTQNGRWFDVPFLNSRLLHWGLPPLPPTPHFDTCEAAYRKLRVRNSLEKLGEFFGCKTKKFEVSLDAWGRAYGGHEPSMRLIVRHGIQDAKLTEEVYLKMRPLGYKHPNIAVITGDTRVCPVCGERDALQSRGWLLSQVQRAKRYQCTSCGTWCHAKYQKTGVEIRAAGGYKG